MVDRITVDNRFLLPTASQKCLSFNGTSDLATVPITPSPLGFSLGFWVKKINEAGIYLHYKSASTTDGFSIFRSTSNRVTFQMHNGGSLTFSIGSNPDTFLPNIYYFLTLTYIPNECKCFLNTTQVGGTDTDTLMSAAAGQSLTICRQSYSAGQFAKANIYRLTLQNTTTPWTTAQINNLYWSNSIPDGATQWSMNNTNLDTNGENGLTLTGTTYSTDAPFQPRSSV